MDVRVHESRYNQSPTIIDHLEFFVGGSPGLNTVPFSRAQDFAILDLKVAILEVLESFELLGLVVYNPRVASEMEDGTSEDVSSRGRCLQVDLLDVVRVFQGNLAYFRAAVNHIPTPVTIHTKCRICCASGITCPADS